MFGFLKKLMAGNDDEVIEALNKGGTIIDVRSAGEFASGSAAGAINIPHTSIRQSKAKLAKMKQPIILCCASGMRSSVALGEVKQLGYSAVNGKTWIKVNHLKQSI